MDATLRALLSELFRVSMELDQTRLQLQQVQSAYTDLKEATNAVPAKLD